VTMSVLVFIYLNFLVTLSMSQLETCASILAQLEASGHVPIPCLSVPTCDTSEAEIPSFEYSDGHDILPQRSKASICYTGDALRVGWTYEDDIYLRNDYLNCGEAIYNQEVAEVFLAPGLADSTIYHEIDMSVNHVLWIAKIFNPYLNSSISSTQIPCDQSGIISKCSTYPVEQYWEAEWDLPFTLITDITPNSTTSKKNDTRCTTNMAS